MARSCRLTCLKIEGSNLLKHRVEANLTHVSYDPELGWTAEGMILGFMEKSKKKINFDSDGPKSY